MHPGYFHAINIMRMASWSSTYSTYISQDSINNVDQISFIYLEMCICMRVDIAMRYTVYSVEQQ